MEPQQELNLCSTAQMNNLKPDSGFTDITVDLILSLIIDSFYCVHCLIFIWFYLRQDPPTGSDQTEPLITAAINWLRTVGPVQSGLQQTHRSMSNFRHKPDQFTSRQTGTGFTEFKLIQDQNQND